MAIPNMDDFLDRYGFNDGAGVENRDWEARDIIVRKLNRLLTDIRAVPYDRPGFHNPCMILLVKVKGPGDPPQQKIIRDLAKRVRTPDGKVEPQLEFVRNLPDLTKDGKEIDTIDIIYKAYQVVDHKRTVASRKETR